MEPNTQKTQDEKIDEILKSVKSTERYMKITTWVTVVVFVLPLLILLFAIPAIIRTYTSTVNGLL